MLRVRPRVVFTEKHCGEIAYVRFECSACGHAGPLSITEDEALFYWLQEG